MKIIEVTNAHNGIDDGHPDEIGVPPGTSLIATYLSAAVIVIGLFFYFRNKR